MGATFDAAQPAAWKDTTGDTPKKSNQESNYNSSSQPHTTPNMFLALQHTSEVPVAG